MEAFGSRHNPRDASGARELGNDAVALLAIETARYRSRRRDRLRSGRRSRGANSFGYLTQRSRSRQPSRFRERVALEGGYSRNVALDITGAARSRRSLRLPDLMQEPAVRCNGSAIARAGHRRKYRDVQRHGRNYASCPACSESWRIGDPELAYKD